MAAQPKALANYFHSLVPSADEAALAAKTQSLLADDSAQPSPNTFVLERMQQQTLNVYERLLDDKA